jgi:hypothetical protein
LGLKTLRYLGRILTINPELTFLTGFKIGFAASFAEATLSRRFHCCMAPKIFTFFGPTGQGETVVLSLYFKYLNVILQRFGPPTAVNHRKWHLIDLSQVFEEVVGARINSKRSSVLLDIFSLLALPSAIAMPSLSSTRLYLRGLTVYSFFRLN